MAANSGTISGKRPPTEGRAFKAVELQLTDEQKRQIISLIKETGNADVRAEIRFSADVKNSVIAAATVLAGAAI